nr:DUF2326 domain-containing protein [uncultured Halomonas sp.]
MLKSISCEKLIDNPLTFNSGLNSVVGADDAHNSIGKSSVLMLIDFAFGGSDFPEKCDDVIRNVGDFKVGVEFQFEKLYSFIRDTKTPKEVYSFEKQDYISLEEFHAFLKEKYIPENKELRFRECVSGFFRIYQRGNYNDKRPLDIVAKDKWTSIRKRVLKIFDMYWTISELEKEKSEETRKSQDITGTFSSGAVRRITKAQLKRNYVLLEAVHDESEEIKNALRKNVTDIKSIINERNLSLKREKDLLLDRKMQLDISLSRVDSNLSGSKIRNSQSFKSIVEFFPEIDQERLYKVESFHQGISKILKSELQKEKSQIIENIIIAETEIAEIDAELLKLVDSKEGSVYLLERLMDLNRQENDMSQQNEFWEKSESAKERIKILKENIDVALESSIAEIEEKLNAGMRFYINRIYDENPISPTITLSKGDYQFDHGDDRGTGKGYANMIAFDLTFLDKTCLPCLIHDSLLFKNMDTPAIEHLLNIYSTFTKQIFISIDEKSKYSEGTQKKIESSMFLQLDKDRVAFNKKWKKESA